MVDVDVCVVAWWTRELGVRGWDASARRGSAGRVSHPYFSSPLTNTSRIAGPRETRSCLRSKLSCLPIGEEAPKGAAQRARRGGRAQPWAERAKGGPTNERRAPKSATRSGGFGRLGAWALGRCELAQTSAKRGSATCAKNQQHRRAADHRASEGTPAQPRSTPFSRQPARSPSAH